MASREIHECMFSMHERPKNNNPHLESDVRLQSFFGNPRILKSNESMRVHYLTADHSTIVNTDYRSK